MKSMTRVGLGVCVYLGALLVGVPGALANHLMVQEAVRDTDTNFILSVPVSVQKLGDGVTGVTVACSISAGGHVIGGGPSSKGGGGGASRRLVGGINFDRFTGTGSGTVTFRLHVFDPERGTGPIGPVSATCKLLFDGVGVITPEGMPGPVVGTPPTSSSSKAGGRRGESAYVKPGATIEVSGNFP
jgi:hypothetical protein